ncbi:uncharacterized protein LOC124257531 [Haliotis rubra]|uniref:uncharacterized protein LOC124257531 n=1 Tax=Haliotis rubra TaxID=36100 RepID=UPI001EE58133|nr:uncharacterized protein LOC124257531 [Haliotis rubra]
MAGPAFLAVVILSVLLRGSIQATITQSITTISDTPSSSEAVTTAVEQGTTSAETATTTATTATTTVEPASTTAEAANSTMDQTTTTVATTTASDNAIEVCELEPKDCKTMSFNMTGCFCYCPHKAHTNAGMFIMSVGHVQYAMYCPWGLVWSQAKCMCDNPPTKPSEPDAIKDLPVFSSGCKTLVNYAYNATSKAFEDGRNFVRQENTINKRLQVVQSEGATVNNSAANFINNSIDIPYLNGNDLTDTAFIEVRIKPVADNDNVTRVILSNGCIKNNSGETSVIMSFNAEEGNFYVAVRTAYLSNGVCENMQPDIDGWYKLTLSVKNSKSRFLVNDQECLTLNGRGSIAKTTCNLSIGGDPFMTDYSQDFNGYIDYVKVIKHCSKEPPK